MERTHWQSLTNRIWELRPAAATVGTALSADRGLLPVTGRILAARGLQLGAIDAFLQPGEHHLLDPGSLKGLPEAVRRIEQAIEKGEHIRLVTDYDVDGTTSCLILHAAIDRRISASRAASRATISYHIPDRFVEGYGLSEQAVDRAAAEGVSLLITADIGVRDHVNIARARSKGLDVVVCDHHLPPGEDVPQEACAVICPPQQGCAYPNKALAACGVSLKLATALLAEDSKRAEILSSMLKLAAIGTVADVVDLATPENRAIVSLGLERLNGGRHAPGLSALLDVASLTPGQITTSDLGFRIGPRINAAGRLKDANAVVRLLRERDEAKAKLQARELDQLNKERQGIQEQLVTLALSRIPTPAPPFVVVAGPEEEGWHRGVVGIVAAKVRDRVQRPVVIGAMLGPTIVGSVRSVPAVHAVRALDTAASLLIRYGGHAAAAGFTLPAHHLAAFEERLIDYVISSHDTASLIPRIEVDAALAGRDASLRLVDELRLLEPCGKGNPAAQLVLTGVIDQPRVLKDKHLKFRVDGIDAVWWNEAERLPLLQGAGAVLGHVERNSWNGRESVQIKVEDVA